MEVLVHRVRFYTGYYMLLMLVRIRAVFLCIKTTFFGGRHCPSNPRHHWAKAKFRESEFSARNSQRLSQSVKRVHSTQLDEIQST